MAWDAAFLASLSRLMSGPNPPFHRIKRSTKMRALPTIISNLLVTRLTYDNLPPFGLYSWCAMGSQGKLIRDFDLFGKRAVVVK